MLPFPIPHPISAKSHLIVGPDRQYSLSAVHSPLLSARRLPRPDRGFHTLMSCPSHTIDLQLLYFHGLTNCFSRKPFDLINICVATGCHPHDLVTFRYSDLQTNQVFYIHTVTSSFSSQKESSALESATSGLFHKNTRGGGTPDAPAFPIWKRRTQGLDGAASFPGGASFAA